MRKLLAAASIAALFVAQPSFAATDSLMLLGVGVGIGSGPPAYTGPGDVATYNEAWGLVAYSSATRGNQLVAVCDVTNTSCVNVVSDASTGYPLNPAPGGIACDVLTHQCTIQTFKDIAGGGNDQVQTTSTARALWIPPGSCPATFNVLAACFKSSTATFYTPTTGLTNAQPFSFAWIGNRNTGTGTNTDIIGNNTIEVGAGFFGSNNDAICYAGSGGLDTSATDGVWHAVSCAVNGGSSSLKVDTATTTTGNAGTTTLSGNLYFLDENGSATRPWQGYGLFAGAVLSDQTANLATINSNLKTLGGF